MEPGTPSEETLRIAIVRRGAQVLGSLALWAVIAFAAAGTVAWSRAWIYVAVSLVLVLLNFAAVVPRNPAIIAARSRWGPHTEPFERVFIAVGSLALLAVPLVAGFDAVRFEWAPLPSWTLGAGLVLLVLGDGPIAWALATNPFLEPTVRIQDDRGHEVVTNGPYRVVRHPMYSGMLLQHLGAPLLLGSAWAFVPTLVALGLLAWRILREERMLKADLPGYADYMQVTTWRLVPGLW